MTGGLTVVIAARNCAERLEKTVLPWRAIAKEIVVADQMSTDATPDVALKLGCRLIRNDSNQGNFDVNRKLAMQQAKQDWILYIDTDERPTTELLAEIKTFIENTPLDGNEPDGVRIPNRFYFLGRQLKHGLFNPRAAEIRMVRAGRWEYPCEEGFHRGVSVAGRVVSLKNYYKHFNVNSLGEWFLKTNQYTEHDAESQWRERSKNKSIRTYSAFFRAVRFFIRHYFFKWGFLDGFAGLVSIFYFMLYHLTLDIKIWEKSSLAGLQEERDYLKPLELPRR